MENNIRALRKEAGLTQRELAELMGISNVTLCRWETGTKLPKLESLFALAQLFRVPLDAIYPMEREEGDHAAGA